jgi:type III secretion protein V
VALACLEILKRNAFALFGKEQVAEYAASLTPPLRLAAARDIWPPPVEWLREVLRAVVGLRVSVADRRAVATALADADSRGDARMIVEDLVARLRPRSCEIHLSVDALDRLVALELPAVHDVFPLVRDGLFVETGLDYPPFELAVASDLKPGSFAFMIGSLRTPPIRALSGDECLVNDTSQRLAADGIPSRPALNPATDQPAAIVALAQRDGLGNDRTAWDFREHFMLSLAAALRDHGRCFVDRTSTRSRLHVIEQAYPATAKALAGAGCTDARVTAVLRDLASDGVSIRNMRRIVDLLVEHARSARDDCLLMQRVRGGLSRMIADKYARGTDTVVVYLVDGKIEQIASALTRCPTDAQIEAVLTAVRTEQAFLPPTAQRPAILTTARARPMLRDIVRSEFPRIPVICFEDLPGAVNVQPVARISLT